MPEAFQAVQISDRVHWVGAIDWSVRNFHGYQTSRGTTYNAYLITSDPPILVDTVKAPFRDEMLTRIASVIDPARIRTIISNHAEMDHSGSLPQVAHLLAPDRIVASRMGAKALERHFHWKRDIQVVGDGERLELGDVALQFVEARMLHWPDSMFSYLEGDGVLFSNDGFGMHLASHERFVDQLAPQVWRYEAAKYYANILLLFSQVVEKLLARLPSLGLDIQVIAPDHGPVHRRDPEEIIRLYGEWAAQKPARKAVVVYDTMWDSTAKMARAVGEGLASTGIRVKVLPLQAAHRSDVVTEVLDAGALVVGSPTMNNQMFPTVADTMTYLKGLRPRNLVGAAFGSYGWSGEAVKHLEQILREMDVDVVEEALKIQYVPDRESLTRSRDFGASIGSKMKQKFSL